MTIEPSTPLSDVDHVPGGAEPVSGRQLQRLAMSGSLWTAVHAVTSVPVAFVANAVVARSLGVDDYGSLALLVIVFGLATQVANGGFSDSLLRSGAEAEAHGDTATTDALLRRSLGFHVVVELPVLWLVALVVARDEPLVVVVALLLSSAMACVFGGASLFLTLANRGASAARLAMATNLVVQVAVAATAVATAEPVAVLAARFLAGAALVPLSVLAVPRARRPALFGLRLPRRMPSGFWRFAAQSFAVGLIGLLVFSRSEVILLGWFGTPEAVGLFALAFGLSIQLTAPVDAMLNPMAPAITGVVSAHPELAGRAFLRAARFSSLVCALITGALLPAVFFAIPWIYGEEFGDAALLLLPLAVASCLQSMGQTATAFAFARQQGGRLLRVSVVALAVNVATGVPLVIGLGVWGAVVANVAGQLAAVVLLARGELRLQGLTWWTYLSTTRIWLVSLVTGAATVLGVGAVEGRLGGPGACVVAGLLGGALVVVVGRLVSAGLDADDVEAMVEACPRRARPVARTVAGLFLRRTGGAAHA